MRRGQSSPHALAPMALTVAAGCASALAPVLVWRVKTGAWVCLQDWDSIYYLRIAAEAYYHHPSYIGDVATPGGVTGYPWLQFVPAIYAARALDAGPFAVNPIWILASAVGVSASLYFLLRHFVRRPWIAAGCAVICLSDLGFADRPFITQLQMLVYALWLHRAGLIGIPWSRGLHWRVPDPALDLPFLFFQAVALARARENPTRARLALSGLAFGLLFYVFFYCWTMAAAGLCIALLLDRERRELYVVTLCIGLVLGLPEIIHLLQSARLASPGAIARMGLFTRAPRLFEETVPVVFLGAMAAVALWIRKSRRYDLLYLWSLVLAGILLGRSRMLTGVFFHEYHYNWLWTPLWLALMMIVAVGMASMKLRLRPAAASIWWFALMLYVAGGVYLAGICVTRTAQGVAQLRDYMRYQSQRLDARARATPLVGGATIAGDDHFCELAAVAEDQRVLGGPSIPIALSVEDGQWQTRVALDAYLRGRNRAEFEAEARYAVEAWIWERPRLEAPTIDAFLRRYDDVVRAPDRFIARFGLRYVALAADDARTDRLRDEGWTMLQRGPYWQIWERAKSGS